MNIEILKQNLIDIGLSSSEAVIYITLLKTGECSVAEISQHSGLHRTNIYDSLEKLKEKGFVSYISKNNKQFYRATSPKNVLTYLKEKEAKITGTVSELDKLQAAIKEKIIVEVFKGKEGIKSALKEILVLKHEVIGYSIAGQLREYLPEFAEYYFREQERHKIKHRFIYTTGTAKPPSKFYTIKYLPKEYAGTTATLCYNDCILNLIWEPELVAIKIKCLALAQDYKKHFELLWKKARI